MNEEEIFELEMDYVSKMLWEDFAFDKIRPELEERNISEKEIARIVKNVDDLILSNSVENKLQERRYKYEKSGIGILFTLILFLFYLAYRYEIVEVENIEGSVLIIGLVVISFFAYRKVKTPSGKFTNRNKFKND